MSYILSLIFDPWLAVCSQVCSLSYSLAESFCEVVLGQYLKPMACQVQAEFLLYVD